MDKSESAVRNMLTAIAAPLYDVGVLSDRGMLPCLDSISSAAVLELKALGLGPDVASAATRVISDPEARKRFITFADDVQISFDMLERAEIYLFD